MLEAAAFCMALAPSVGTNASLSLAMAVLNNKDSGWFVTLRLA